LWEVVLNEPEVHEALRLRFRVVDEHEGGAAFQANTLGFTTLIGAPAQYATI
jgi:hypothetical protein